MTTDKGAAGNVPTPDAVRKRSPRYPIVGIDEALERARLIYNEDRRAFATFDAILEHMGYKAREKKGGRSARMVATLNQYGLLEKKGGQYRVSDTAFRIFELPEDNPERAQLIRQAALSPPIISKVLRHYKGELPSDTTLRSHLVLDEEFNRDSAGEFIRVLRRTIQVANPSEADYNALDAGKPEGEFKPAVETPMQQTPAVTVPKPPPSLVQFHNLDGTPAVPGKITELAFKLSRGSEARVTIIGDATQEAIGKLMQHLDLTKDTFPTVEELHKPRAATWKNKDHDQPVTVTGDLGQGPDGKHYLKIAESDMGVPEEDLVFEDAKAKGAA